MEAKLSHTMSLYYRALGTLNSSYNDYVNWIENKSELLFDSMLDLDASYNRLQKAKAHHEAAEQNQLVFTDSMTSLSDSCSNIRQTIKQTKKCTQEYKDKFNGIELLLFLYNI